MRFPLTLIALTALTAQPAPPPIIDVHLHAMPIGALGPPPAPTCAPVTSFLPRDPKDAYGINQFAACTTMLRSPSTDDDLLRQTLAMLTRFNITAVTSGSVEIVRRWKAAAPDRIIPALQSSGQMPVANIRTLVQDQTISVLGELGFQYGGMTPSDAAPESYFAVAEELDVPVAVHMGPGAPGAPYFSTPKYEMRLSNPLLLEPALVRHPKMRLYIMHAGWPMIDETIALLYAHPQVYVDVALIDWYLPRAEFHRYLRRLVEAGFDKRIMFGSDQTLWPETIALSIDAIESADFLSAAQKRDIFYNNAVRFLRLPPQPR